MSRLGLIISDFSPPCADTLSEFIAHISFHTAFIFIYEIYFSFEFSALYRYFI